MRKTKLICNTTSAPPSKSTYHEVTVNLAPTLVRHDSLNDRPHIVVPMVMMVEGVHAGSNGPLYYPEDELSTVPQVWNAKPVVVYHPEANGQGVSACDPTTMTQYSVGVIMNTKWDAKNKRLTAEAWIEESRVAKVDNRVVEAIEKGEMMEVSTGLFLEIEEIEGTWKGSAGEEAYVGIARNYKPDHLAILPDKIGACSVADGAGLLRNEQAEQRKRELAENELSHDSIRKALYGALHEKFPSETDTRDRWIEDVFSNFFVYMENAKFYRLGFTIESDIVSLQGDPQEVIRVTEYRTIQGTYVGNTLTTNTDTQVMKDKLIKALMEGPVYNESHKELLASLDEKALEQLKTNSDAVASAQQKAIENASKEAADKAAAEKKAEEPKPATTVNEYISQAPEGIRDTLVTMQQRLESEKANKVAKILANERNKFSEAQLKAKPLSELEMLEAFLPQPANQPPARYDGQGDPVTFNSDKFSEPLVAPELS